MEYFAKREETMNCKVQKYRVLVMGLLILSLMGLSGCGRPGIDSERAKTQRPGRR